MKQYLSRSADDGVDSDSPTDKKGEQQMSHEAVGGLDTHIQQPMASLAAPG